jgi:hypothetical protein
VSDFLINNQNPVRGECFMSLANKTYRTMNPIKFILSSPFDTPSYAEAMEGTPAFALIATARRQGERGIATENKIELHVHV